MNKKITLNIVISFLAKASGLAINFLLFRLLLDCIGERDYGIWLTISSIFMWLTFFDFGVGNGLKNLLTRELSLKSFEKAKQYISSAYFIYSVIFLFLTLLFYILSFGIDWLKVLDINLPPNLNSQNFITLLFLFFSIRFVLNLIISIGVSFQFSSIVDVQGFFINFFTLLLCLGMIYAGACNFHTLSFIYTLTPIVVLTLISIYLFRYRFHHVKPSIKSVKLDASKELFSLGNKFLVLQIVSVFILSAPSVLIKWFISAEEVVVYNAGFRYFSILSIAFQTITFPFWAAFTKAYTEKNITWIKQSINKLIWVWSLFCGAGFVFLYLSDWVYEIWLGGQLIIPGSISTLLLLFVLITSWNSIYIFFCNALGILKIQIILSLIVLVSVLPLAYYFSVLLKFETQGIILTFILLQGLFAFFLPIKVKRTISSWS